MTKTIPTIFTIAICLLVGGGCVKNSQLISQPAVTVHETTNTPANTNSAHNSESVSSTVSLLDRPVSEWPRYEFKELGFSIALPIQNDDLIISKCINTNCQQIYYRARSKSNTLDILGSYGENYQFGDPAKEVIDFQMTYIHDFIPHDRTISLLFPGQKDPWNVDIIVTSSVSGQTVYFFDAKKEFYANIANNFGETDYPETYQAVFKIKKKMLLKSVALTFTGINLHQLNNIISTIIFLR